MPFNLTTSPNRFTGSDGVDDTFSGVINSTGQTTLETWDVLDGKGGSDTLLADMNGNVVSMVNISSIENVILGVNGVAATLGKHLYGCLPEIK